jgi:alkylation response protein AidB-like acyl-CoA dehydrogenase
MRELGLFGVTIAEEHGGLGLDLATYVLIQIELSRGWMSLSGILNTHFISAWMLARYGTETQRSNYLPRMSTGELRFALSISEPAAGSDVQAIKTRAVRDGDEFVIDGQKMWVTNGQRAGAVMLQFMAGIELGRVNVASRAVGLATRAFEEAIAYAQRRETFGKAIAHHQAVQLKLAQMATKIEAARLLTLQAATKKDAGDRADLEAGMAKFFATETAQEVVLESMRIHGAYGYAQEGVVERLYRDAPLLIIGEGSNEIQQLVIARRLLERHGL